jgi:hypothetical protein
MRIGFFGCGHGEASLGLNPGVQLGVQLMARVQPNPWRSFVVENGSAVYESKQIILHTVVFEISYTSTLFGLCSRKN